MTEFEEYLQGFVGAYYENVSKTDREMLLERIVCDSGNKRYVMQGDEYRIAEDGEKGDKVYDLAELQNFPDMESEEFKSKYLDPKSTEHQACVSEINTLIGQFKESDCKAAMDLKALLEHSDIEYRVRKDDKFPNGTCNFQKGENGKRNKILICVSDLKKLKKEDALPEILAHELAHAVEFSKRPDALRTKYMDGSETAADLYAASLLFHCKISDRGFSQRMGEDYDEKKKEGKDTRMKYTPDGGFRRDNFTKSAEVLERARERARKREMLNGLRGLPPEQHQPPRKNENPQAMQDRQQVMINNAAEAKMYER